ncbi:MAG: chemotaxis protein CheA [Syntrophomonas sp.]|jgi:two-component system chemotaxis sensor kinase CheA|uniref:chemotaxis protein CheA n=1 Tax=Syntrophomonas sp. TaxID=2053627 RepID=UPI0026376D02|nr:chemotaxis protein CheA [Syntrophomonas sp.]MDD2510307.1 chemotaxis protein CheA [Syntrophomonas sp.]MDD3878555.1 chemotaxis protein CheA [Syntrophomonas sp.]MDD4626324.1 chemotaxis protein CheA [Syntrophomonas sp.]
MKFVFEPDDLEILQGIVEESSEHLNGIEEGILKLEAEFDSEQLDAVFRAMHSVKGVAAFLDLIPIKDTAHSLESFMTDMKKGLYPVTSEITDILLKGVDILQLQIRQLGEHVKKLEVNPPREKFELHIKKHGFQEFVQEAGVIRNNTLESRENGREESCDSKIQLECEWPEPVANVMKIEISSFREQLLQDFFEETSEHLDTIEKNCVELERQPEDLERLNAILRGFHSIKGAAGVINSMQEEETPDDPFQKIKNLSHVAESLLQTFRNQQLPLSSPVIDIILEAVDRTAALSQMVQGMESEDLPIEDLLTRINALSDVDKEANQSIISSPVENIPRQFKAFVNITNQALESMENIIASAREDVPISRKRVKQYLRALNSIASSSRYLEYEDVQVLIASHTQFFNDLVPGEDLVNPELIEEMKSHHGQIKKLLGDKVADIKDLLSNVPIEYGEKRIGEILVAQQKLSQEELNEALAQQKKIGEILIDRGKVTTKDVERALLEQQLAQEKRKEAPEPARVSSDIGGQSIRVSQDKMNRLMNMIGELLISKNRVFHLASTINLDYELPGLAREVKDIASEVARISDELQDAIMSARMVPLRILFQRYPRTIRDISRKAGKNVDLVVEGEETELDKTVIEAINDPLVHMLRNAVDHGIETPDRREAQGKPRQGKIYLKARYQGNNVIIEISDDGKGMNPEELKLKALGKGLIRPEQIESMSNEEVYQLIFLPGFSTREEVSELSGRGVGMDVVKNNIEQVGGTVTMSSQLNQGTNFLLRIPLSMSIIRGLMVKMGSQSFILPLDSIEETVKLPAHKIRSYKKVRIADIRDEIVHLIYLKDLLNLKEDLDEPKITSDMRIPIVIINYDGNRFGLVVDSFQHEQEFVVKTLAEELAALKIYTGATIMGDGSVVLILNPGQLYQLFLLLDHGG